MAPMPGRKGQLIFIGFSLYLVVMAIDELEFMPLALAVLAIACWLYVARIKERQQWRDNKLVWWCVNRELETPVYPDWDAFERAITIRKVTFHDD